MVGLHRRYQLKLGGSRDALQLRSPSRRRPTVVGIYIAGVLAFRADRMVHGERSLVITVGRLNWA